MAGLMVGLMVGFVAGFCLLTLYYLLVVSDPGSNLTVMVVDPGWILDVAVKILDWLCPKS